MDLMIIPLKNSVATSDFAVREYQRSEKRKGQTSEILSRPAKEARVTIPQEDIIEEDEELDLAMSQIVEKDGFESDSTIEYEMSQIDIPNTFSLLELYSIIVQLILSKERFLELIFKNFNFWLSI